jgi:hypothetical protein
MREEKLIRIYQSFEDENQAECKRRAQMTPQERCREFSVIQARVWGERWQLKPIKREATWEILDW